MARLDESVRQFLSNERIAVAGVSRGGTLPANAIYKKLRGAGHHVFAVNPKTAEVEGDACYPTLGAIPGGVGAVVIATPPGAADALVRECADLGIGHVWMHRSFGEGSVSGAAAAFCRERGIQVIDGACPMMFVKPDVAHRCIKWFLGVTGKLPRCDDR
jgi:predicted CoA-binding protein